MESSSQSEASVQLQTYQTEDIVMQSCDGQQDVAQLPSLVVESDLSSAHSQPQQQLEIKANIVKEQEDEVKESKSNMLEQIEINNIRTNCDEEESQSITSYRKDAGILQNQDLYELVQQRRFRITKQIFMHQGTFMPIILETKKGHYFTQKNEQLMLLSSNLAFYKRILSEEQIRAGIVMNNKLFLSFKDDTLVIFDAETLQKKKSYNTQIVIRKFLQIDEKYLLMAFGTFLYIIDTSNNRNVYQGRLQNSQGLIFDIDKTENPDEFVLAIGKRQDDYSQYKGMGIRFVHIKKNIYDQFMILENSEEFYLLGENAFCVKQINSNLLLACIHSKHKFQIIDRTKRQVIAEIQNPTGDTEFNSLQKICKYDYIKRPYMFLKDQKGISLIDCQRLEAIKVFDLPFQGIYCGDNTMLLTQHDDEQIKIISLGYNNTTAERIMVEVTI